MAKLQLVANPTFKAKVGIKPAGGKLTEVEFTFRHRTKTEMEDFVKSRGEKTDTESFMDMVTGWELDDPFDLEHVETLLQNYAGAALATFHKYVDELYQAKLGN